ncbi:MAG: FAD-dependent oxidoreductase [Chloroflexi bacterium]|nr:FAD-dependent oxidoreductase [Chloroflexota bacterium]
MIETAITMYGAYWCPDCRRSKHFLGEHQIPYRWVDIEQESEGEQFVIEANHGRRIIPTLVFEDGSILVEPSNADLAAKLGLKMVASRSHYDLVIVGGGPAGLTAAIFSTREGLDTLIIERAAIGGQAALTEKIDNMPGFHESVAGIDFCQRLRQQAEKFGVEILQAQDVVSLHSHDNYHCVNTADGSQYSGNALLISTGSRYRRLRVPGENAYLGAGVHFCASCDGAFYKGKQIAVVGGGNSATEESLLLTKYADKVTMLVRGGEFNASKIIQENVLADPKIEVRWHTEVQEFIGEKSKLKRVLVRNNQTGQESLLTAEGAFIFIGMMPNTDFLNGSDINTNEWGFIITGHDLVHDRDHPAGFEEREPAFLETSVPGIFAAGDVRDGSTKQVAAAIGEGSSAATMIHQYLKTV